MTAASTERSHGTCPGCSSGRAGPYRSLAEGDWAVSCAACGFEAARAPTEEAAWAAWDAVAGPPVPDDTEGGIVPGRYDAPDVERLSCTVYTDRCGDHDVEFAERPDGGFVRFEDHERALAFERGRSDALQGLLAAVRTEPAASKVPARPVPVRTYWQCRWSSHQRFSREGGTNVVSTAETLEALYEDLAGKRIAHLHDEDSVERVFPDTETCGDIVFRYGPVRRIAVEEERQVDETAMEASRTWVDFHARRAEHLARRQEAAAARLAEDESRAEAAEAAEYERLKAKYGKGDPA